MTPTFKLSNNARHTFLTETTSFVKGKSRGPAISAVYLCKINTLRFIIRSKTCLSNLTLDHFKIPPRSLTPALIYNHKTLINIYGTAVTLIAGDAALKRDNKEIKKFVTFSSSGSSLVNKFS